MQGGIGIPRFYWCGTEGEYNILVMELLGASIEELVKFCNGNISLASAISLAEQFITRVEYFHGKNFIHRDIKPDNFVMGHGSTSNICYLIDYGLSKRYRDPTTKMHIPYKNNKRLTGTARYASLNTHMGIEQSRRDDLECLALSLIYIFKGSLPWQGIKANDKTDKYNIIMQKKKAISIGVLCKGLPLEFANIFHYCRSLKFEDKPDYAMLKKSFTDLFYKGGYFKRFDFDWKILKLDLDFLLDRDYEESFSNNDNEDKKDEIIAPEVNKEKDDNGEKIDKVEKDSKILLRTTSEPMHLNALLANHKKLPVLFVTKKLKEMKQNFLSNIEIPEISDDEIPDENAGEVNRVKEFNFIENVDHWKTFKSQYKKGVELSL